MSAKASPCPQCGKPDWCTVGDYGVVCMRVQSARAVKNGGWFHAFGAAGGRPLPPPPPRRQAPAINATALHRAWLASTTPEAVAAFAASLGLSEASLAAVGAAWAPPHSAWAFPMCDGYGNVIGIRLRNERGKFAVRGSRQGIFLAAVAAQKTLFVCEGPTDTAAAVELGLFAAGRPNCCCGGLEVRTYARRHECAHEHAERLWLPQRHAEAIRAMVGRHKIGDRALEVGDLRRIVAGTDVFSRQSDGTTIAAQYAREGITLKPANMDRVNGWAEVMQRLGDGGASVRAKLFIHKRCGRLAETLPAMQHDPNRPEDVLKVDADEDGVGGDDAADALRYLVATKSRTVAQRKLRGL